MRLLAFFTASLLVGLVYTAPTSNETPSSDKVAITKEFFPDELAIYTAEYDIVNILLPLNSLNFDDDTDEDESGDADSVIFFVLADNENGKRVDKGLYIRKHNVVTKLLDNGRDAAAINEDSKTAYFAAKDGLYSYNDKENKAEKYGTITDSIIGLAKSNNTETIYILTEDHFVYKVTEGGTKKEKLENIVNAQQIVLDYDNNLYYYTSDNKVYVLGPDGVKKFDGLPEQVSYVNLLRPPFIIDNGVPLIMDNKTYIVYVNGTVEAGDFVLEARPTAYSMEGTLVQYYAYNKKIYEYNLLTLLLGSILEDVKNLLQTHSDSISDIATRSRSDLRAS